MEQYPHFTFTVSDPDETDLVLVSLHDSRTNYTVRTALPNSGKQTASIMAFAGARYSRASISAIELFKEIKQASKSANEKLATIFRNYGHASVADMAQLFAYIENIPQLNACKFYNETSVGGGQERSTRYQDFSGTTLDDLANNLEKDNFDKVKGTVEYQNLSEKYQELQSLGLSNYRKYVKLLTTKFTEVYQVDSSDKKQVSALTARVFDSARYFLPSGACNRTSLCWITSAREWARLISQLKCYSDYNLNYLGEQLEVLFAPDDEVAKSIGYYPEAPDLIRYTAADETTNINLTQLQYNLDRMNFKSIAKFDNQFGFKKTDVEFLDQAVVAGVKVVAQNILSLYPTLDEKWLIKWINNLSSSDQISLGKVIFEDFDHHQQMGNQFRVNTHSFVLSCSVAEGRDLNRHRAWGRFVPLISSDTDYYSNLENGYTLPMYLTENPLLQDEKILFENDLLYYYTKLREFAEISKNSEWFPHFLILQLLPFAHIMKMWFHGSPKEISYLTKIRVRPGGHINYRVLAFLMAQKASQNDFLLAGLALEQKPDPNSREEFLDRG